MVILALSLQTLNLVDGQYRLAFGTSVVIGTCNLLLYKLVPQPTGWMENLAFVAGGPFGAISAMRWHPLIVRIIRRRPMTEAPHTQQGS